MITLVVAGMGTLTIIAVVVGVLDARQGPTLRLRAAERRRRWEAGHPHDADNCGPER